MGEKSLNFKRFGVFSQFVREPRGRTVQRAPDRTIVHESL
jgi:hypothetical protein